MDTSAVNNAAQSTANAAVSSVSDNALPKNTPPEGQDSKPAEPTTTGVTQPLQVAPETNKPVGTPAATSNGTAAAPASTGTGTGTGTTSTGITGAGLNGTEGKPESLVPEEIKPTETSATEKPASLSTDAPATTETAATSQPSVMTGANPSASEPKPTELAQDDGVKDVNAATAAAAGAAPVTSHKPTELNGSEKKDIDIKDAPLAASASEAHPTTASAPDTAASNEPTAKPFETGEKRKAETDTTNGAATAEEPAEKKQKSTVEKVVDKAKEVVEDVKEKASSTTTSTNKDNGPARKASKRGKKEAPPVGRTERKTRSQGRVE